MTLDVHWLPHLSAEPGDLVTLTGEEAHHAVAVRRLRAGQQLRVTDGRGRWAECVIVETDKRSLTARCELAGEETQPTPQICVVQALAKGDRGELAVELMTELGVARIVPWSAGRSVSVWRGERANKGVARWRATAKESAKQSRRNWFPAVDELTDTAGVVELIRSRRSVGLSSWVLHEEASAPLVGLLPVTDALLVVGPEGGVAPDEVARFVEAGAEPVRLGKEVLRTSTAGAAALAAILSRSERWS